MPTLFMRSLDDMEEGQGSSSTLAVAVASAAGLRMTLCPEETVRGSVDLTRERFPKTRFAPVSRADLRLVALEVVPLALQRRAIGDVDGYKSRDISAPSCAR